MLKDESSAPPFSQWLKSNMLSFALGTKDIVSHSKNEVVSARVAPFTFAHDMLHNIASSSGFNFVRRQAASDLVGSFAIRRDSVVALISSL